MSHTSLPTVGESEAKPKEEKDTTHFWQTNISGFIYVSECDEAKRKMTILAPSPGRLPKNYFVMGSLKWME